MLCSCGENTIENAKFCYNCGTKINVITKCCKCDTEIIEGAAFCHNCGEMLLSQNCEESINKLKESKSPKEVYQSFFDYIGNFKDGFAPVIDCLEKPTLMGYVSDVVDEQLVNDCLYHNRDKYDLVSKSLFSVSGINWEQRFRSSHSGSLWIGEFENGKAYYVNMTDLFELDINGKHERIGELISSPHIRYQPHLFVEKNNNERLILDFKGKSVLQNMYLMVSMLDASLIAIRANDGVNNAGLFSLREGRFILADKYENFEICGDTDAYDKNSFIKTSRLVNYVSVYGYYYPFCNKLMEPQVDEIFHLHDNELMWENNILFIAKKAKDYLINNEIIVSCVDENLKVFKRMKIYDDSEIVHFDAQLDNGVITFKYNDIELNEKTVRMSLNKFLI